MYYPVQYVENIMKKNFEKLPIRMDTRRELIEWLIDIHNEVNIMNNKKIYTYNEVYEIYNDLYMIIIR